MTHGFDLNSALVCEGIIGDGCGGGRLFVVEDGTLFAHDSTTNENITLMEDIIMPRSISKKACVLTIVCENETIEFDLSAMTKTLKKV